MNSQRKALLFFILTLLLTNCVSVKIDSKKDPSFTSKVKKIYFLTKGPESSRIFLKELTGFLRAELYKKGITSDAYFFESLSLDSNEEIKEKIIKYDPEVICSITQVEKKITKSGDPLTGVYSSETGAGLDIKLMIPNSEKPVWRSSVSVNGNFGVGTATMSAVKKIAERMKIDGLID